MRPDAGLAGGSAGSEPARRFGTRAVVAAALLGLFAGLIMGGAVARDVDPPRDRTQDRPPSTAASSAAVGPSTSTPSITPSITPPSPAAGPVIAHAELRAVPADSVGSGLARLVGDPTRPILEVTSALPGTTGFYQVWLADQDFEQLYALGILDSTGAGHFPVPPGIDLAVHTLVDVSAEPLDGNPTHSGTGMLRGELD